jgi:hypothetical protein
VLIKWLTVQNLQGEYNKACASIKGYLVTKASGPENSWRLMGFQPPADTLFGAGTLSFSAGWFMRLRDVSKHIFMRKQGPQSAVATT